MTDALPAHEFATTLRLDKGRLDLDDFAMQIAGGGASGHATLRRDAETATLTGALTLDSIAVDRPGFSGRVGADARFRLDRAQSRRADRGLAGVGTVKFAGAALARSDPAALDRVVAKAQTPDALLDETNIAFGFGNELNRAPLPIPDGSTPISLSAGVMKVGPISNCRAARRRDAQRRPRSAQARRRDAACAQLVGRDFKFWSGPPPSAKIDVENALETPKRQLDVSSLSAGLAAQAIARETDRIAALEADIRERAFFNRRLKGERFMDRRQQEIEDWRAEQARLKGLTEHLRAEEEAEKAAEAEGGGEEGRGKPPPRKPTRRRPRRKPPAPRKARRSKARRLNREGPVRSRFALRRATKWGPMRRSQLRRRPRPGRRRARAADPTQGGLY